MGFFAELNRKMSLLLIFKIIFVCIVVLFKLRGVNQQYQRELQNMSSEEFWRAVYDEQ